MATIHFSSGKTRDIDANKLDKFIMDLKGRGIKLMVDRTPECILIVPLNSNTMEFIEDVPEVKEVVEEVKKETTLEDLKEELQEAQEDLDSKKDIEEKQKQQADEVLAKSSCTHPADKMVIYRHDTKKGSRFFPVCSFCGKRERYVKAESLSDEVKESAPIWED